MSRREEEKEAAFTEIIQTFRKTVRCYDNENIIYVSTVELHYHHGTFPKQIWHLHGFVLNGNSPGRVEGGGSEGVACVPRGGCSSASGACCY